MLSARQSSTGRFDAVIDSQREGNSGMRVVVVGTGYVGLVSGACFADFGHHVTCIDKDANKIAALRRGDIPIYEVGLTELVSVNTQQGRLEFSTDPAAVVPQAEAVVIAVGTPSRRIDGHADLSYLYSAVTELAPLLSRSTVIITKSTVPIGTADEIERMLRELRPDGEFLVVSNPEFLREGTAIKDFKEPDRIVVGTDDARARVVIAELYQPLYLNSAPILFTGRRTAEVIKYAANAFLATKIAFINEIADLCEHVGADVQDVSRGMGLDDRIGTKYLRAGPGFGGYCLPKDALALIKTAQDHGTSLRIVEATVAVNEQRKRGMARKVTAALDGSIRGKTIAVLGLTFKPETDDMREAPSIALITALHDLGAKVRAFDPAGMEQAKSALPEIAYCDGPYSAAEGAHAVVIMTEWEQFRALDFAQLKRVMASPVMIDLKNVYRPDDLIKAGFVYEGVGRSRAGHSKNPIT